MEMYDEVVEIKRKPKLGRKTSTESIKHDKAVLEHIDDSERTTTKRPASSLPRKSVKPAERVTSESESSDTGTEENIKISTEGFDYRQWENLDFPSDIKDLYQYIAR